MWKDYAGRSRRERLLTAANLYEEFIDGAEFVDFLTVRAYEYLE